MMPFKIKIYTMIRRIICPFDKIIELIPSDGELLDVGSGYGIFCFLLGNERSNLKITGMEIDDRRVKIANIRFGNSNIHFVQGDMTNANFKKKFDHITCIDVFHHIPYEQHKTVLTALYDCLKENGHLIIKDMDNKPCYKYVWNYIHDIVMTGSMHMYYLSKRKMIWMLENNAFVVEKKENVGNILYAHYYISCIKRI